MRMGFVQFSGEDSRKIRSGIENGVPKGLGLKTNPLNRPVQSGPSIGCMVWGYDHFAPWVPRTDEAVVLFGLGDFYSVVLASLSAAAINDRHFVIPRKMM